MKKLLTRMVLAGALTIATMQCAQADVENYNLDPEHTSVLFHISHFGFSNPSGKWYAKGTLKLDSDNPANSQVNVTIPIADIDTGIKELDEHLLKPVFFDAAKYPTATFVSNKVTLTGKETADVQGILTLHGVSKPITLHVTLNKAGISPLTDDKTVGFSAYGQLLRSDFGMNSFSPGIGDEVKLSIEAEAHINNPGAKPNAN